MKYALTLLTHGDGENLDRCVESLAEHVRPLPWKRLAVIDGPGSRLPPMEPLGSWEVHQSSAQEGFCRATRRCWDLGVSCDAPFVLHLEGDFLFTRSLNLKPLAAVLLKHSKLAQMQLMRNAVSLEEKRAGGLFQLRSGEYAHRGAWLEHRSYYSTNVNLMRQTFMARNVWPDDELPGCEGRFSIELVTKGYSFGVWGDGESWTEHVGRRRGFGY